MIQLHQFPAIWSRLSFSPMCGRVEAYLRLSGLSFEIINTMDFAAAPRGILPYLKDGKNTVPESGLSINYLIEKRQVVLPQPANPKAHALALTVERTLTDHLHWVLMGSYWLDDAVWDEFRKAAFEEDSILDKLRSMKLRKTQRQEIQAHGIGRGRLADMYESGSADLAALDLLVQDQPFLCEGGPGQVDATAFAFLDAVFALPAASLLRDYAQGRPTLKAYYDRVSEHVFGRPDAQTQTTLLRPPLLAS